MRSRWSRLRSAVLLVTTAGYMLNCSEDKGGSTQASASSGGSLGTETTSSGGSAGEGPSSNTSSAPSSDGSGGSGSGNGGAAGGGSDSGGGTTGDTSSDGAVGGSSAGGEAGVGGAAGSGPGTPDGPALEALVVDGARYPLMPDFTPDRLRFSVLPSDPVAELQVTAVAADDLDITIDGVPATSGEPVSLPDRDPRSEFDVTVEDSSGEQRTYTVLYLPADFPEFHVTVHEPGTATDPLYLSPQRDAIGYAVKLDNAGVPLFYRKALDAQDFKKHSNGLLSYSEADQETGADQVILDEDFNEIGRVNAVGYPFTDQHDFHALTNGNYLVIGRENVEQDLTPFGGPEDGNVINRIFQELTPEGQVEFEWTTWGNVDYEDNLTSSEADYAHANGLSVDAEGNWLISLRHTAQVVKVDRTTGDVIWRLGGVSSDFSFVDDPLGGFCGLHTPSVLDNGHLLIFDNGAPCPPDRAEREGTRIVEYALDEVAMTATLVFSYERGGPISTTQGSAQRQSNGNTLIGWGGISIPRMVTEVDPDGNVLFELEATLLNAEHPISYRAYRFPD